jgi:citronellyl-CoA dehydrogenase
LPGFQVSKKLDKLGMRASDTAELFFDDLRIPAENLIGEEGEGFIYQMKQFVHERFSNVVPSYACLQVLIDMTVAHLKKRVVFGEPLIKKQVLRHRIAQWLLEIECLKRLCYHITKMRCEGLDATNEVTMAKIKVGQLQNEVIRECLRMHGGLGYMNEMKVSQYYRDSILNSIGGGATEPMLDYLARRSGL